MEYCRFLRNLDFYLFFINSKVFFVKPVGLAIDVSALSCVPIYSLISSVDIIVISYFITVY